jgi:DNA-binding response OmpR family regulator
VAVNVVIAQNNTRAADALVESLQRFGAVSVAHSAEELKSAIPARRPKLVVLDLETVPMDLVRQICQEFSLPVVCTHRVPDEEMWAEALQAGAIDCCKDDDVRGIIMAARRNVPTLRTLAA